MKPYAGVVIEAPLSTVYHYRIPPALAGRVEVGMRVTVPFGLRRTKGFVVSLDECAPVAEKRLKDLHDLGDGAVLATPEILELARWIASYYRCGWGEVLAAAVPGAVRKGTKQRDPLHLLLAVSPEEAEKEAAARARRAPRQAELLRALSSAGGCLPLAGAGSAEAARALERKGLLAIQAGSELTSGDADTPPLPAPDFQLTPGQQQAVAAACEALDSRAFSVCLLHGATASGKTEVYLRALLHCLSQGRTGIVLVPEISLTPQTVERFRARVGRVAVLHSHLSEGERAEAWRSLRRGETRVAIGARSAVFAPLPDLGLVIVDEEHERTFKQDSAPRYHARDAAVVRAQGCGATVLLGSATPSLESYQNARNGKYRLVELPERVGEGRPPATEIVDMRREFAEQKRETLFSRKLERALAACLERKEQAILFLNRRGFHTWIHCLHCKSVLKCPDCDISLTYHKELGRLLCHYCEYRREVPDACPDCGARRLRFAGSGTERVEEALATRAPGARTLRMDSDTMSSRDAYADSLAAFGRGEYDILLGTQMIAKGLDFPNVTLIGVIFADAAVHLPDFRAAEQTFQLVAQVVGRSGRGARPGLGIIQAFDPEHYAIQLAAKQDYAAFVERELADRHRFRYPPFARLARILVRGPDPDSCFRHAEGMAAALRAAAPSGAVLGPAPCALRKIQGLHRFHLVLKGASPAEIRRLLDAADRAIREKGPIRVAVDIDPVSLL